MKKLGKRLGIVIIIGVVLYGVYMLFVIPNGYVSEEEALNAFFDGISGETICEDTWNESTLAVCDSLVSQLEGHVIEVIDITKTSTGADIELLVDDVTIEFTATFYEYEPSGLRSFTSDTYYLIESIH